MCGPSTLNLSSCTDFFFFFSRLSLDPLCVLMEVHVAVAVPLRVVSDSLPGEEGKERGKGKAGTHRRGNQREERWPSLFIADCPFVGLMSRSICRCICGYMFLQVFYREVARSLFLLVFVIFSFPRACSVGFRVISEFVFLFAVLSFPLEVADKISRVW